MTSSHVCVGDRNGTPEDHIGFLGAQFIGDETPVDLLDARKSQEHRRSHPQPFSVTPQGVALTDQPFRNPIGELVARNIRQLSKVAFYEHSSSSSIRRPQQPPPNLYYRV